ncbi:hypothetical protein BDV41DRAFT_567621 [Aspergillus transmontanensis]|uniref:Copper transport protein n=1 Tax=Aspergillus transmontanensis TaxID=1034304 RepID=A0A5N6VKN8_9EURO|nr:hypothetical protein BDV41DRAFT_567621 [Aspergillus transmontanensis]
MDPSMHHSGMDMDHGHGGHGDMDMGGQCNMNMLFTWSAKDLCIIFRKWRVDGPFSLLVSLVVIVLLTAGYEGIRQLTRRYEAAHAQRMNAFNTSVLGGEEPSGGLVESDSIDILKAMRTSANLPRPSPLQAMLLIPATKAHRYL